MRMKRLLLALIALLLTACSDGDVASTLGLDRSAPDEFKVVSRPPLSVPPEFTLRPPMPGEDSLESLPADKLTRSMITGSSVSGDNTIPTKADGTPVVDTAVMPVESGNAPTGGEAVLLEKLGAPKADQGIREKIYQDRIVKKQEEDDSWIKGLNPFGSDKESINASEEAKKLKQEGKPTTGKHLILDDKKPKEEGATVSDEMKKAITGDGAQK